MIAAFALRGPCSRRGRMPRRNVHRRISTPPDEPRRSFTTGCGTRRPGVLQRCRDGRAEIDGFAGRLLVLIYGLLNSRPGRSTGTPWLEGPLRCNAGRTSCSGTPRRGGLVQHHRSRRQRPVQMKDDYDGAEPSASSVSVLNLLVLSHLHDDPSWTMRIEQTLACMVRASRADGACCADDGVSTRHLQRRPSADSRCRPGRRRRGPSGTSSPRVPAVCHQPRPGGTA